jgi:hypothetical protein
MNRKLAKERLFLRLEWLARSCKPPDTARRTIWPDRGFLRDLENEVMFLIATERKEQPSPAWKGFQLLNKRLQSLQLVLRVNNLVKRARERLEEAGERPLNKLQRQAERGDEGARKLLRDIAAIRDGQNAAKKIDWTQHERALAQFSRTRSVEPSYGRSAPLESRCYARALELVVDDYRRKPLRDKSWPLVKWLARIGHPEAKSLCAFDDVWAWIVEREEGAWRGKCALRRREKGRDRIRRYREWHRGRSLYPGDWIWFRDAADFHAFYGKKHPLPKVCVGLEDSEDRERVLKYDPIKVDLSCDRRLADGFYYNRTGHLARCRDCQEAEWWAQGFEVVNGFPYGDWDATTAERLAERKRDALQQLERQRRWLQTTEGQQWLAEANRRFVARLKEKARQHGWTQEQLRAEAKAYGLIR